MTPLTPLTPMIPLHSPFHVRSRLTDDIACKPLQPNDGNALRNDRSVADGVLTGGTSSHRNGADAMVCSGG